MKKKPIDKSKPNIIHLHKKDPELAKQFITIDKEQSRLKEEVEGILDQLQVVRAKANVLFGKVRRKYKEDIDVIAPEGNLTYEVDGEEVFLLKSKGCDCPSCNGNHPAPPKFLKELMKKLKNGEAEISGVSVGNIDDLPDDVKKFFRGLK